MSDWRVKRYKIVQCSQTIILGCRTYVHLNATLQAQKVPTTSKDASFKVSFKQR